MEENAYSLMTGKQFAKEIGRTLVVGMAQSTAVYLGMIAAGFVWLKVSRYLKARKKEETNGS
jgi:hypothetical protein